MDANFSDMLKDVMSDPDAMSKLMSVAEGLMKSEKPPEAEATSVPEASVPTVLTKGNEERIALISAIRPYLSPERQKSADSMIKMLKVMKLTDLSKLLGSL